MESIHEAWVSALASGECKSEIGGSRRASRLSQGSAWYWILKKDFTASEVFEI